MTVAERPFHHLCPEADKRDAMNNAEKVWICDGCRRTGTMSELRISEDGSHS